MYFSIPSEVSDAAEEVIHTNPGILADALAGNDDAIDLLVQLVSEEVEGKYHEKLIRREVTEQLQST